MTHLKNAVKKFVPQKYFPLITEISGSFRSVLYSGDKYICPCCNGRFRKFISGGYDNRPNAVCPQCNTLERHRLLWLYFKNQTNLFTDKLRVLHICPEYLYKKTLTSMPNLEYIGAGIEATFADIEMNITDIQEPNNSYDVILCNHVLEHVPDDHKAMQELFRVLKPSGWAILQVPIDVQREKTFEDFSITSPKDREIFFGKDDHVRVYGLDYKNKLENAGFTVKVEDYTKKLGTEMIEKYCLPKKDDIYFCTKSL